MTTAVATIAPYASTDAYIRAFAAGVNGLLSGVGLVQTADTGQINVATVVSPAVSSEYGYSMWQFNDALQASSPIFIRIGFYLYWQSTTSSRIPVVNATVGTGTDGAGAVTGIIRSSTQIGGYPGQSSTQAETTVRTCRASLNGSTFVLALFVDSVIMRGDLLIVERRHDAAGTAQADGLLVVCGMPTSFAALIAWNATGNIPMPAMLRAVMGGHSIDATLPFPGVARIDDNPLTTSSGLSPDAVTAPVWPLVVAVPSAGSWVSQALVFALPGDYGAGAILSPMINGAACTFLGLPPGNGAPRTMLATNPAATMQTNQGAGWLPGAIRWE